VENFADGSDLADLREKLLKELGIMAEYIGVGVDRIDYTKGILERFLGIERFLKSILNLSVNSVSYSLVLQAEPI